MAPTSVSAAVAVMELLAALLGCPDEPSKGLPPPEWSFEYWELPAEAAVEVDDTVGELEVS